MKKKLIIPLAIVVVLLGVLLMWTGCKRPETIPADKLAPKTLTFWGVWDDSEDFDAVIKDYEAEYGNIDIEYRKLKAEEYEDLLFRAWSAGEGPDIFMVHNSWMREYQTFLAPMPETTRMARFSLTKNLFGKEERQISMETITFPRVSDVKNMFVDVVSQDVVIEDQIYGLPLSVDTLALYYNRDLLSSENIFLPPTIWEEFSKEMVPQLTKQDEQGNIVQSGAALGTNNNIDRAVDVLALLMLQNGTLMINEARKDVAFANEVNDYNAGLGALEFYTDFASPAKIAYSWNQSMPDALETFVQGQLAFMFGYSYHISSIEQRGTRLNYGIAPMLHINPDGTDKNPTGVGRKTINMANYWVLGVHTESDYPEESWSFINFIASQEEEAEKYLEKTSKPGALVQVLNTQKNDPVLEVFANQALSAQSWYTGYDAVATEGYFKDMIDSVILGRSTSLEAITLAAEQVEKTLSPK
ncbi:MAG: extracellular solute-binding protein [Patescibacteria group bacterium]